MGKKLVALLIAVGMCFSLTSCMEFIESLTSGQGGSSAVSSESVSMEEESSEVVSNEETSSEEEESSSSESESSEEGGSTEEKVYVTITFKQAGQTDVVKTVEQGKALTDIPTPAAKTGYKIVWDTTDFANVTENMTVNAVETAKTCTIVFDTKDENIPQASITVTYGEAYELPTISHEDKTFKGWRYDGNMQANNGVWEMDVEGDLTFSAVWEAHWTGSY